MDKPKTSKEQETIVEKQAALLNELTLRVAPEKVQRMREYKKLLDDDFDEKQEWITRKSRKILADKEHFALLLLSERADHIGAINSLVTFFCIDYLESRLSNLENIVQGLAKHDLSNMEKRIQQLHETLNQPELAEVARFIHDLNASIEKGKQAQKEYNV